MIATALFFIASGIFYDKQIVISLFFNFVGGILLGKEIATWVHSLWIA